MVKICRTKIHQNTTVLSAVHAKTSCAAPNTAAHWVKLLIIPPCKHEALVKDPTPMRKLRTTKSQLLQKLDGFHTNQLNML